MIFTEPITITDALRSALLKRTLALSPDIGTDEIQKHIPAAIRRRAFFSARTPYAEHLTETMADINRLVQPDVLVTSTSIDRAEEGESISPAQVRAAMKQRLQALDYQPEKGEEGTIKDLSSDRRTNLIISTQLGMNRGYGTWRQSQNPTVLDIWPADELYRAITKKQERDWQTRWNDAKRSLSETSATWATGRNGPFVALKNDEIWVAISAFDNPYPPFDFGSGMRRRDVTRARAIDLGVLKEEETVEPETDPFVDPKLEEIPDSVPGPLAAALRQVFSEFIKEAVA